MILILRANNMRKRCCTTMIRPSRNYCVAAFDLLLQAILYRYSLVSFPPPPSRAAPAFNDVKLDTAGLSLGSLERREVILTIRVLVHLFRTRVRDPFRFVLPDNNQTQIRN